MIVVHRLLNRSIITIFILYSYLFSMITVIYLARFADELGQTQEQIDQSFNDSDELLAFLRQRGAPWDRVLAEDKIYKIAVNNVIQHGNAILTDHDQIALLPPVTGG